MGNIARGQLHYDYLYRSEHLTVTEDPANWHDKSLITGDPEEKLSMTTYKKLQEKWMSTLYVRVRCRTGPLCPRIAAVVHLLHTRATR